MYTLSNKNPSAWNFLSPETEVTCDTVAIIIRVVLLSPYLRIRGIYMYVCTMTRIMMATVLHATSGSGLRKFQADGFLFDRVYTAWKNETNGNSDYISITYNLKKITAAGCTMNSLSCVNANRTLRHWTLFSQITHDDKGVVVYVFHMLREKCHYQKVMLNRLNYWLFKGSELQLTTVSTEGCNYCRSVNWKPNNQLELQKRHQIPTKWHSALHSTTAEPAVISSLHYRTNKYRTFLLFI